MAYELKREEGRVIAERDFKVPRSDEVIKAEVRSHLLDSEEILVVWYCADGWRIFCAGPTAERFASK